MVGCGNKTAMHPEQYRQNINRVNLGMSKNQFLNIFPLASKRGAKRYSKGIVELFELSTKEHRFFPSGKSNVDRDELSGMEYQKQWFYFYENTLIQYGLPQDWPSEPDLVIENRIR